MYWVDFDPAGGGEIRKRRPAIIVSNDASNATLNRVQVVPVTSNLSRVYPWEALVYFDGRQHKAMADQLRTVAKERLSNCIDALAPVDLRAVEAAMRVQLGMT